MWAVQIKDVNSIIIIISFSY